MSEDVDRMCGTWKPLSNPKPGCYVISIKTSIVLFTKDANDPREMIKEFFKTESGNIQQQAHHGMPHFNSIHHLQTLSHEAAPQSIKRPTSEWYQNSSTPTPDHRSFTLMHGHRR